jgi:hypothetical protein
MGNYTYIYVCVCVCVLKDWVNSPHSLMNNQDYGVFTDFTRHNFQLFFFFHSLNRYVKYLRKCINENNPEKANIWNYINIYNNKVWLGRLVYTRRWR